MITKDGEVIVATARKSCQSLFGVELVNRFGKSGGFEGLVELIDNPEVNLQ